MNSKEFEDKSVGVIYGLGGFHARKDCIDLVMKGTEEPVQTATLKALQRDRRRIAMLIDSNVSQLPPFLTKDAGLNSGFMIAHVTAASLASENKSLAHPASVDSLPTSANQEDHVSMATFAARRLQSMVRNTAYILSIEWLAAAQGIEFLRPLQSSVALEKAMRILREQVSFMDQDRWLSPDIEAAATLVNSGQLSKLLPSFHLIEKMH